MWYSVHFNIQTLPLPKLSNRSHSTKEHNKTQWGEVEEEDCTVHGIRMGFFAGPGWHILIALWSKSLCFFWQSTSGQDRLLVTHLSLNAFQCRETPETPWAHNWSLHLLKQSNNNVGQGNIVRKMTPVLANGEAEHLPLKTHVTIARCVSHLLFGSSAGWVRLSYHWHTMTGDWAIV